MYDKELVVEVFRQLEEAARKVMDRFQHIRSVNDFVDSLNKQC
jgi:hypothetical protein